MGVTRRERKEQNAPNVHGFERCSGPGQLHRGRTWTLTPCPGAGGRAGVAQPNSPVRHVGAEGSPPTAAPRDRSFRGRLRGVFPGGGRSPPRPRPHGGLALSSGMWATGRWVSAAVEAREPWGHGVGVPRVLQRPVPPGDAAPTAPRAPALPFTYRERPPEHPGQRVRTAGVPPCRRSPAPLSPSRGFTLTVGYSPAAGPEGLQTPAGEGTEGERTRSSPVSPCSCHPPLRIKVSFSLRPLPGWEHPNGHDPPGTTRRAPSVPPRLVPASSRATEQAAAGIPCIAPEPSLDKQETRGCLMEKVAVGERIPLES
ncbi:uncharacterized protein ACIBXB_011791 [Morphnus guianensis]